MTGWGNFSVLVKSLGDRVDRGSTLTCPLKVVRVMLWTRAGTWGIAYSHEPAGGGACQLSHGHGLPRSCACATEYLPI